MLKFWYRRTRGSVFWRDTEYLLSIDYLVKITGGTLTLSDEHSAAAWCSIDELKEGSPVPLDPEIGFQLKDFQNAKLLIDALALNL